MDTLSSLWDSLSDGLFSLLPLSPFRVYIHAIENLPYLGVLNWFFPFRGALIITGSWLTVVGLFFGYSCVMRWIKVIGG